MEGPCLVVRGGAWPSKSVGRTVPLSQVISNGRLSAASRLSGGVVSLFPSVIFCFRWQITVAICNPCKPSVSGCCPWFSRLQDVLFVLYPVRPTCFGRFIPREVFLGLLLCSAFLSPRTFVNLSICPLPILRGVYPLHVNNAYCIPPKSDKIYNYIS